MARRFWMPSTAICPATRRCRTTSKALLAAYEVGATIEEITDEGDDQKRTVALDWLLILQQKGVTNSPQQTRRQIVKCTVERQGKQWKITALEPIEFFKY